MKKFYLFLSLLSFLLFNSSSAQSLNMNELYNFNASGHTYNDCWGYVDDQGNEYAIVGTKLKIYFYDITDPSNVVLVDEFSNNSAPGLSMTSTRWRDFKTFGTKAYACADEPNNEEGLLVFDLSNLPSSVTLEEQNTSFFFRAHNIFIDTTSGYLYTAGANTRTDGTIILDLNVDPIVQVASVALDDGYIHDLYVNNDLGYCNSGSSESMVVVDFSTPTAPVTLGMLDSYNNQGYNHSCWPTESGDHIVMCDETNGRTVKMFDVSDPNDIFVTDDFHSNSPPTTSIAHNPIVKGDFAYVSYYDDGVYIFDISDPNNVSTFGYFDTNPGNAGYGCWGVYPYFPSGNIIATDGNFGFYVLEVLNVPLPVDLTHFSAVAEKDKVKLEWTTASEENSDLFEVQKSVDGVNFETIAKVDAAGESDFEINYQLFDERPFLGDNYYRLMQVDFDGKFEYSEIEVVRFSTSPIDIYPTLVKYDEPLNILFSKDAQDLQFQIFSIEGQLVKNAMLLGVNGQQQQLWLDDLPNGSYVVQAINGNNQVTKRIVIAR